MSIPAATARYVLFILNLVFLVSALAVAVVAVLTEISFWNYDWLIKQDWTSPAVIIGIVCAVIFIVSIFGCCGVINESRCCLILFSALLIVVILAEIIAGVYIYLAKEKIGNELKEKMIDSMKMYNISNDEDPVKRSWGFLQTDMECCGFSNASDWRPIFKDNTLPESCCKDLEISKTCTTQNAIKIGCFQKLGQIMVSKTLILAGIAIGVGVAQMLCAVASAFLARHIHKQYQAV